MIDLASDLNLIQKINFGTRKSRSGNKNILELVFTNNHNLISNIYDEHSEISDHDYIVCETSHELCIKMNETTEPEDINLSSYVYVKADWVTVKAKLRQINWSDILQKCTTTEK